MLETITIAIMVLGILAALLGMLFSGFMLIRNHFVYENHMKVINAIHEYNQEQISLHNFDLTIEYYTEPYDRTMWRLWDFGCEKIVTPDIYKKIEPYL